MGRSSFLASLRVVSSVGQVSRIVRDCDNQSVLSRSLYLDGVAWTPSRIHGNFLVRRASSFLLHNLGCDTYSGYLCSAADI